MVEIYGHTIKYYQKEKNGDHYKFEDIKGESTLIAIVADGVSRQPCDWYASKLACNKFLEAYKKLIGVDIKDRIFQSIVETNTAIKTEKGDCQECILP